MKAPVEVHQILDTCGTRCPIPLLRAKIALKDLRTGEYLQVLASDPSAKPDFEAMLSHLPHTLVDYAKSDTEQGQHPIVYSFVIEKG